MKAFFGFCAALLLSLPTSISAQGNSGSNGSDGALNSTANLVIDMANHPDVIYNYTSVNIPVGVTVSFIPNAGNKPVVWLVQGDCVIGGTVDISGKSENGGTGGASGPGGWRGGSAGDPVSQSGQGSGAGSGYNAPFSTGIATGGGSYGTIGSGNSPGSIYGNAFLLPLQGGSGGGGRFGYGGSPGNIGFGGGGGGGAILIAASSLVKIDGLVNASSAGNPWGGGGSGGGVRIATSVFTGQGSINATGGNIGGSGRVRIDAFESNFSGSLAGTVTQGLQPIIIPAQGQGIQLSIAAIAGNDVPANPSGVLVNPDVIIPAQQTNPIPIVVNCNNIPLNTEISVIVHPANGPDVQAVGINNTGTVAASTATVSLNMPRGGGFIYAKCVSGLAGLGSDTSLKELRTKSLAETGWTVDGERFAKVEVTAGLGGQQQIAYITESGKRYSLAAR